MSSEQLIRRENKSNQEERNINIHVAQGELPQVAHYESLTVMDSGAQPAPGTAAVVHRVVETIHGTAAGGIQDDQSRIIHGKKNQSAATLASSKNMNYGVTQKDNVVQDRRQYAQEYRPAAAGQPTGPRFTDAAVDVGKKGATYLGEAAVAGKNVAVETGKTAGEFAGKAAGVAKDAALVAGYGAAELAGEATTGVAESMENLNYGVSGIIEGTANAVEAVVGAGKRGVGTGKDIAVGTGKTTAKTAVELGGKAAGVAKDAALAAGWGAAELASETQEGLKETMEGVNTGVGGVIESAAIGAEIVAEKALGATGTVVDVGKKGASYIGGTGKTTAGIVRDATMAAGRGAAELASETQEGVKVSVEGINAGVGGLIETAAVGAEIVGGKVLGAAEAVVGLGNKGVAYIGEKAVAGKDATGEFVGKTAGVAKDATLAAGWGAAELASDTAAGVTESMETLNEGIGLLVEGTALASENVAKKTFDTVVDVGKKGVVASGKATTKGVGVVKDAALAAGRGAAGLARGTTEGFTESMETLNEGVGVVIEGTAHATEAVVQKTYGTAVDVAVTGKDIALETGKAATGAALAAGRGAAYLAVGTTKATAGAVGMAAEAAFAAGRGAAELAVDTTKATAGAAGMVAGAATDAALAAGRGAADLAVGTTKATAGAVGMAAEAAFAAGRGAAELAVDATEATAGAAGMVAGAATNAALAAGRGAAEFAVDTTKATAGAAGMVAGAATDAALATGRGAAELAAGTAKATAMAADAGHGAAKFASEGGRGAAHFASDGAGAGYGVRTNVVGASVGPDIVVERETVTVDFKNQGAKETKKAYKEQTGYYRV
ncbi:uncharacterized protein LOC143532899 [Bidens hawaiensis]|uniref:uncharacterized protein LOC143532899 n=1 Tax=Bidens hawaiensis TaxID=980011 RepID=UPI00404A340F